MHMDQENKQGKRVASTKGKKAALIAGGAAAVVLCAYAGLCAWVGSSDAILNHVSVGGVDVSGMTQSQASQALEDSMSQAKGAMEVDLSYGTWQGVLSGSAAQLDAQACAQAAWEVGRENFLLQGGAYLSHLMGGAQDIDPVVTWTQSGESELNALLDEADQQVSGTTTLATYAVEGEELVLTKGRTGVTVDREQTSGLVLQALADEAARAMSGSQVETETVELPTHETLPQDPDFDAMYSEIHTEAQDAQLNPDTLEVSEHVVGVDFDLEAAKTAYAQAGEGESVRVPLTITQPNETKQSLESKLFRDLLGEGTTTVSGSSNRKHNVKLSAQACNGVVLMPGEVFSYNNTTGSRTAAKGYLSAPVYSGSTSVDEVGGGICQTSSTIYYAVLHTTLEVVERAAHRFNTGYVDEGMDATVYYGQTDFRFKNNTNYPVKIVTQSYDQGGRRKLTVKIYGTNETGNYAVPKSTTYDVVPPTTVYKPDESIPQGTTKVDSKQNPYTGISAQTYRYIYDKNGNLLEKQNMGVSVYKMREKTILYNPADGDPSTWVNGQPPQPQPQTPPTTETGGSGTAETSGQGTDAGTSAQTDGGGTQTQTAGEAA